MKIGIIGTGNVGSVLGIRWAKKGHQVNFGSRDPQTDKVKKLLAEAGGGSRSCPIQEAVNASEVIVLAVPFREAEKIVRGLKNLEGKIILDCTNPLKEDLSGLEIGFDTSAGEQIALWAKGAKVVKAFNTIGSQVMKTPRYGNHKAVLFICGDEKESKSKARQLAEELDFDVIDAGKLQVARYLEPLAMLWIHLAFVQGMGVDFGLNILKRS